MSKVNVIIKKAQVKDLPDIQKLGKELMIKDRESDKILIKNWYDTNNGSKYLLKRIRGRKGVCLIALLDHNIIGYATGGLIATQTWRPYKRSELENLCITKAYRGKDIGTMLVESFKKWSKKKGVERVIVQTSTLNKQAVNFYKSKNFIPLKTIMEIPII